MAKSGAVSTPKPKVLYQERERQEAAYNLLKAAGKRVKPNFEDYLTGRGRNRSLINRAEKLATLKDVKEYTTKDGKKTTQYATFETAFPDGIDPDAAVTVAESIVVVQGRLYNRAQVSMRGFIIEGKYRQKKGETDKELSWQFGPMSNAVDAVAGFQPLEQSFAYVDLVRVYFALNR